MELNEIICVKPSHGAWHVARTQCWLLWLRITTVRVIRQLGNPVDLGSDSSCATYELWTNCLTSLGLSSLYHCKMGTIIPTSGISVKHSGRNRHIVDVP